MVYLNLQIESIAQGLIEAGYSLGDLPANALVANGDTAPTSPDIGQLWLSSIDNSLSIYNGVSWQALGLTATEKATLATLAGNVYTASQVDGLISVVNTSIATKQDTLVSGTNIKTINGVSVLGSGNATITVPMGRLDELSNTTITAPTNGQVLTYDSTTLEWINTTPTSGVTDHTLLTNIGTNTHADIDTALTRLANTSGTNTGDETVDTIKTKLGITTLSGNNTGDQDLSGYSLTTHNHTGVYEPANANIQSHISSTSNPHSVTASQVGALALTGGTMTGAITALRETKIDMGAGTNIDLSLGNFFTKTISGATTITVSNWLASGNVNSFVVEVVNGGSATITWVAGAKWAGGTAPTLTASGVDILGFYSHDGGTTVRCMLLSKDSK